MWDIILGWVYDIIHFFYQLCGDWGMAIIIVTVIFRLLLSPLMHKQARSSYLMRKIQPQVTMIQERFADDKVRQQQELQKVYAEAKFNPIMGCVPMLLQMPIFIALFQVLRSMGERISDGNYEFYNLVPNLVTSPSVAFTQGLDVFAPYFILMIIFAGATFVPMLLNLKNSPNAQQRTVTIVMSVVMSIFMLWISWGSPAGVLLFWGVSSLLGIAQNQISLAIVKREDKRRNEEKQAAVALSDYEPAANVTVTRKVKKKRPKKKH